MADYRLVKNQVPPFDVWTPFIEYSSPPLTTGRVTMLSDLTSVLKVKIPLRYKISGTYYYGVVKAITPTTLDIIGAPFVIGMTIEELAYGPPSHATQLEVLVIGQYADAVRVNVIEAKMKGREYWQLPKAYLVGFSVRHDTDAATLNPSVNVLLAGNRVSTNGGGNGVQVSTTLAYNPDVAINTTNYAVNPDARIEIECTVASNPTTSATSLMAISTFVYE